MHILFTRFPLESRFGGAEVQVLSLMEGLQKRGHTIGFIGSCPVLLEESRGLGIGGRELDIGPPPVSMWHAFTFLWRQFFMKRALKKEILHPSPTPHPLSPDAIIMLSLTEKILLTPYCLANGIRVIWLEHDRVGRWLSSNPWLGTLRKLSSKVTTIVVSELSRKLYLDLGFDADHVIAIPNGIDTARLQSSNKSEIRNPKSEIHVGCVSRLTHDKGLDVLIDAVIPLQNTHLTIVGTGRDEDDIKDLITSKNKEAQSSKLKALRFVEDLGAFYHSLDCLVLPSREHDPFGLVAAEAMLSSVPVIVTDACGIADYLTNGHDALVVPADDVDSLREAIEKLSNEDLRKKMASNGGKTAEKMFTVERMIEKYAALLER